jgi:polyhydroxyalkanoate synthesis regulator phasin
MADLMTAADNRAKIAAIKLLYDTGEISREEAKRLAQPILDRINSRIADIAQKQGRKPYRLDFISAMRNSY